MSERPEKSKLAKISNVAQFIFIIVISLFTAFNSYLAYRQFKLTYKPFIGVVEATTTRFHPPDQKDTYANTTNLLVTFTVENTGSIPAKNVKIDVTGKLGNTILPRIEPSSDEGIIVPPHTKLTTLALIGKNELRRLVDGGEKLIYSIKISYSDLEGYESQEYISYQELELVGKDPPVFLVHPVARYKWEKQPH